MPAQTPQQLAAASACLRCMSSLTAIQVEAWLLAKWAGVSADPQTLLNLSARFQGVQASEAAAAMSYMLAVIAGGSLDPNVLAEDAKCFTCLDGLQFYAQVYLLASITGQSTDPNSLSASTNDWQGIFNFEALKVYLLSVKSGVSLDNLPAGAKCFTCLSLGEQARIQTLLLADIQGSVLP